MSPEEQSRLTVETGVLWGMPAASAAARETYKGEGGWQVPSQFSHDACMRSKGGAHVHTYTNVIDRLWVQLSLL